MKSVLNRQLRRLKVNEERVESAIKEIKVSEERVESAIKEIKVKITADSLVQAWIALIARQAPPLQYTAVPTPN